MIKLPKNVFEMKISLGHIAVVASFLLGAGFLDIPNVKELREVQEDCKQSAAQIREMREIDKQLTEVTTSIQRNLDVLTALFNEHQKRQEKGKL